MLTVPEATHAVLDASSPLPPLRLPLGAALGLRLAESISADRDSPPFPKALLDGFAVRSADLQSPPATLAIIEEITAGRLPTLIVGPGQATAITTGSPFPQGADALVMVEDSDRQGDLVTLRPRRPVRPGDGWLPQGREMKAGETLLGPGDLLTPPRLGLLATVGQAEPLVHPAPRVAVLSTGDEIVPAAASPGPGQIRNSNAPMLAALARSAGAEPTDLGIAPDLLEPLSAALARGLDADVLLVTGGVSAGKLDLVPGALEGLGVRPVFHKVRLKPGKPLYFGVGPARSDGRPGTLVFGLPGNPVSGLVGFLLFVRPALAVLAGGPSRPAPTRSLPLASPFSHRGDRPTYHPARLLPGEPPKIDPLPWAGSPDLRSLSSADGFAAFPPGDADHPAGAEIEFLSLPGRADSIV
jgi:molybdopterin molybdotransferase